MLFTKTLAKLLSFIGLFIGFSSEVLAQYGAPVFFFTLQGTVKDIECNQVVKNANVKLIDRNTGYEYDATTDSLGNFTFLNNSRDRYNSNFRLIISDPDKRKNGYFKTISSSVKVNDARSFRNPITDSVKMDIYYVKYVSGAPCDNEKDTIIKKKKELIKNPELALIENEDADNSNNPQAEGISEFSKFNLFPNPNEGQFYLEFYSENNEFVEIQIININGALIHLEQYDAIIGMNKVELFMEKIAPGTYHCILRSISARSSKTFIVK